LLVPYWLGSGVSGSEEGSYLRHIDFVYHPTLGLRVITKKKKGCEPCGIRRGIRPRSRPTPASLSRSLPAALPRVSSFRGMCVYIQVQGLRCRVWGLGFSA